MTSVRPDLSMGSERLLLPSAPSAKASKIYEGSTLPEQGVSIGMIFAGYSSLETPAISAALLLHHLQRKAIIFGLGFKIFDIFIHPMEFQILGQYESSFLIVC